MASLKKSWLIIEDIIDRISKGAGYFSAILNLGLLLLVFIGVVFRYFLDQPIGWRDEIVAYIFIFASISALCYATYADSHVSSEMLYSRFPHRLQMTIRLLGYLMLVICIIYIIYFGMQTVQKYYVRGWRSESDYEFLLWPVYSIIPLGFLLFGLQCIVKIRKTVSELFNKNIDAS